MLQQTSSFCSGLSLFWTEAKKRGFSIADVSQFLSHNPSKLCGLQDTKGQLKEGKDADLVIWDPEAKFQVCSIIKLNISKAYRQNVRLAHALNMLAGHYRLNAQTYFLFYLQVH